MMDAAPLASDSHDSFDEGRVVAMQLLLAVPIIFFVMDLDVVAPGIVEANDPLASLAFVIGPPFLLLFVFMVGLPIRLDPTPRDFWAGTGRISLFGVVAGAFLLAVAWLFGHTLSYDVNGHLHHDLIPNEILSWIGIVTLAFFLMNARFPVMTSSTELERSTPTPP